MGDRNGFAGRAGFGERPALVVVDMSVGFTDLRSPLGCDADGAVAAIAALLEAARASGLAVLYTTVAYGPGDEEIASVFIDKVPALRTLQAGSGWVQIDPRLAPAPGEAVLSKLFASAFFGTTLATALRARGCDSVIVTGASTSGCIRATVVDALQHGLRAIVPREAVADRNVAAHEANLFDIDTKYGDVVSLADTLAWLGTTRSPADLAAAGP